MADIGIINDFIEKEEEIKEQLFKNENTQTIYKRMEERQ